MTGKTTERLPSPTDEYDPIYMRKLVSSIERNLLQLAQLSDIVLIDDNGRRWTITVDTGGNLGTE